MTSVKAPEIKQKVRERYGAVAQQNASCCGGDETEIQLVDYSALNVEVVADADLGLGCGVPTLTADIRPGETVLDLGSGAGIDVFLAARAVGPRGKVIGVDMTPEMIQRARENAKRGGYENVEFRQGELEDMPVDDDSIDVILSNCVINLVPDKGKVFDEIYRVLKPGGRFSISDIVTFGDVPAVIREDIALWTGCIAGALDQNDYRELIRSAGFENVRYEKEQRYDSSWIPDKYRQALGHHVDEMNGAFGITSVTVVGEK
ncbi:MAG TPA: arsenite methyltransferase [Caldilineae bacterium]|nr:arsenite methyltransferase [Caldilineae bacterium]